MDDCIVAMMVAAGITLGILIIAALVVAIAIVTGGSELPFLAVFLGVLADWWIVIAASVLAAIAAAYQACSSGSPAAPPGAVEGGAVGFSAAFALVVTEFRWRRKLKITRVP